LFEVQIFLGIVVSGPTFTMASTFDASHPVPLVATEEGLVQQTFAHAYDEKNASDEKQPIDEKGRSSSDVEVVIVDGDDVIKESGTH
jgi:hypothetical protein